MKIQWSFVLLFFFEISVSLVGAQQLSPTEYPFRVHVDSVEVYWNVVGNSVNFAIQSPLFGWVGLGVAQDSAGNTECE